MGVKNMKVFLKRRFRNAVTEYNQNGPDHFHRTHLYFDGNFLLHRFITHFPHGFFQELNDISSRFKAEHVHLYFDGAGPMMRIPKMIRNRTRLCLESRYLNLHITPGSEFMFNVKKRIFDFSQNQIFCPSYMKKTVLQISDVTDPGESETKIFRDIKKQFNVEEKEEEEEEFENLQLDEKNVDEKIPIEAKMITGVNRGNLSSNILKKTTSLVIGIDGDLFLYALACQDPVDIYFKDFYSNRNIYVNMSMVFESLFTAFPNYSSINRIKMDLIFSLLLIGNDYLPKFWNFHFDYFWNFYTTLKNHPDYRNEWIISKQLLKDGKTGKTILDQWFVNVPFLAMCLKIPLKDAAAVIAPVGPAEATTSENLVGAATAVDSNIDRQKVIKDMEQQSSSVIHYMQTILWNFDMILGAECQDYNFFIQPIVPPNIGQLLQLYLKNPTEFTKEIQPSRADNGKNQPLELKTICKAVTPEKADLIPQPFKSLEFNSSVKILTKESLLDLNDKILNAMQNSSSISNKSN